MLLMADKNQQFLESGKSTEEQEQASESKNRNRLKSSNYNVPSHVKKDIGQVNDFFESIGLASNVKIKEQHYQTEKFGSHLLMNSDSKTAIGASKLQSAGEEAI